MSNNLNVFKYGYNNWKPRNWFSNCKQFFCNCKYAWQRATKGYCTYDVWDIDDFHTGLMIAMLTKFKQDNNGYPSVFADDENGAEKWDAIIEEMILHFTNYRDAETVYPNEFEDEYFAMLNRHTEHGIDDKGFRYQKTNEKQFTDSEQKLQENYLQKAKECAAWKQKELDAGLALFCKWYQDLWW